jgi:hypothetical protein
MAQVARLLQQHKLRRLERDRPRLQMGLLLLQVAWRLLIQGGLLLQVAWRLLLCGQVVL